MNIVTTQLLAGVKHSWSMWLHTERIACNLCMHLGARRFFMHPTALMHFKKNLK